jgi:VIT1/CCC1 family predicted Fe2+/Mn2+ transporter
LFFGFLPILPFVFLTSFFDPGELFIFSLIFSGGALVSLGYLRSFITMESKVKAIFETVVVGSVSGLIAFGVGVFI